MSMRQMQQDVDAVVQRSGGYWPTDKILLKLTEELGELCQANRKGTTAERDHEIADLLYSILCLINSLDLRLVTVFENALDQARRGGANPRKPDG